MLKYRGCCDGLYFFDIGYRGENDKSHFNAFYG